MGRNSRAGESDLHSDLGGSDPLTIHHKLCGMDWSMVPAWSHKPDNGGSNPPPASNQGSGRLP